jgi:hypothetical protein
MDAYGLTPSVVKTAVDAIRLAQVSVYLNVTILCCLINVIPSVNPQYAMGVHHHIRVFLQFLIVACGLRLQLHLQQHW